MGFSKNATFLLHSFWRKDSLCKCFRFFFSALAGALPKFCYCLGAVALFRKAVLLSKAKDGFFQQLSAQVVEEVNVVVKGFFYQVLHGLVQQHNIGAGEGAALFGIQAKLYRQIDTGRVVLQGGLAVVISIGVAEHFYQHGFKVIVTWKLYGAAVPVNDILFYNRFAGKLNKYRHTGGGKVSAISKLFVVLMRLICWIYQQGMWKMRNADFGMRNDNLFPLFTGVHYSTGFKVGRGSHCFIILIGLRHCLNNKPYRIVNSKCSIRS